MPLILPSNTISAGGYEVANSLRFDSGSSDNLTRTPSSVGNRKTFTISFWVKRCKFGSNNYLMATSTGTSEALLVFFNGDKFDVRNLTAGSGGFGLTTNRLFRDPSAWYHFLVAVDTTQATSSNRVKIYVNGTQETSLLTSNYPAQNEDLNINSTILHTISGGSGTSNYLNGYLAEYCLIDGQSLDPTSFGEFDSDTGIWKPKAVSGLTFGTNGFYLDFENSGSLGADVSGNGNNFTVNNLTSIDQTTDTPTNNYATGNPLNYNPPTFSDGNLTANSSSGWDNNLSTIAVDSGKWYAEFKQVSTDGTLYTFVGISEVDGVANAGTTSLFDLTTTKAYHQDGQVYTGTGSGNTGVSYGDTFAVGDIIGIALDMDNLKMYFSKNGVWQNSGDPTSGATGTGAVSINAGNYYICTLAYSSGTNVISSNFGNPPFTISSGNSDGNGYGNFEYSVPSGYYALNTKNLSEFG